MPAVEVDGRSLRLTNLAKVLWPRTGTTKGDLIDYYAAIAPVILPHIERRPMTLGRFPDGVDGVNWFQTTCPHPPPWMPTYALAKPGGGFSRDYCLFNEPAALMWAANLGSIELHPLLATVERFDRPSFVVFDLDPGPGASLLDCCTVALRLRALLDEVGLTSLAKTSGSVGLHVYVPLNAAYAYRETKAFARTTAATLAAERPEQVVDRPEHARRVGKVFVDWVQNDPNRSIVAPYSLRAMPWPSVATPVAWSEIEACVASGDPSTLLFDPDAVRDRLDRRGDLFEPAIRLEQALPG